MLVWAFLQGEHVGRPHRFTLIALIPRWQVPDTASPSMQPELLCQSLRPGTHRAYSGSVLILGDPDTFQSMQTPRLRRTGVRRECAAFPGFRRAQDAFTIVEAIIAMAVLGIFAVSSVFALMSFNDRAARNRNAEAARGILESNVDAMLAQATAPATTAPGTDLDGDGLTDGVLTTPGIPLVVQRNSTNTAVVQGDLYTLVKPVGTLVAFPNAGDLLEVQYMLRYFYRGETHYSKLLTFKSSL